MITPMHGCGYLPCLVQACDRLTCTRASCPASRTEQPAQTSAVKRTALRDFAPEIRIQRLMTHRHFRWSTLPGGSNCAPLT